MSGGRLVIPGPEWSRREIMPPRRAKAMAKSEWPIRTKFPAVSPGRPTTRLM